MRVAPCTLMSGRLSCLDGDIDVRQARVGQTIVAPVDPVQQLEGKAHRVQHRLSGLVSAKPVCGARDRVRQEPSLEQVLADSVEQEVLEGQAVVRKGLKVINFELAL